MKSFYKLLIFFALFFSFSYFSSAEDFKSGVDLSNSVYQYLISIKQKPVKQNLINSGENDFAYNIYTCKKSTKNTLETLILAYEQEDFDTNREIITRLYESIALEDYNFNLYILFTFGDNQEATKRNGMVFGTQSFVSSISNTDLTTAIIVQTGEKKNEIHTSTFGITSPSWLIQNEYQIFYDYGLGKNLQNFFLSQIFKSRLFRERGLTFYSLNEIQCIELNFTSDSETQEKIPNILKKSLAEFEELEESKKLWDQHFIIWKSFGKYFRFSENRIVHSIIVILVLCTFFIIFLGFVNLRLGHEAWVNIRKIWYTYPGTFHSILAFFFVGRLIAGFFTKDFSDIGKIYFLVGLQSALAFFASSFFYTFIITREKNFNAKTIDFLIVASTLINLFVFLFYDISLFPIFFFIFIVSIFALKSKTSWVHILFFILMIVPYVPYAHTMIGKIEANLLLQMLQTSIPALFVFSLIFTPIFLIFFRILASFGRFCQKKIQLYILAISCCGFIAIFLILLGATRTIQISSDQTKIENLQIEPKISDENLISFSNTDKVIFGETIRTLNINTGKPCLQCEVTISSEDGIPLLYSDNQYTQLDEKTISFTIPYKPSQKMIFTYGTELFNTNVSVRALYFDEINSYYIITRTFEIEAKK